MNNQGFVFMADTEAVEVMQKLIDEGLKRGLFENSNSFVQADSALQNIKLSLQEVQKFRRKFGHYRD